MEEASASVGVGADGEYLYGAFDSAGKGLKRSRGNSMTLRHQPTDESRYESVGQPNSGFRMNDN